MGLQVLGLLELGHKGSDLSLQRGEPLMDPDFHLLCPGIQEPLERCTIRKLLTLVGRCQRSRA